MALPLPLLSIYDGLQQAFSKCNAVPEENDPDFAPERAVIGTSGDNVIEDSPIERVLADKGETNLGSPFAAFPELSRLWSSRTDVIQYSLTWGQHSAAHAILLNSPHTPPTTAARLRGMGGQHSAAHAILLNSPLTPPTTVARLRGMGGHLYHL
eukprot:CAMPEP_0113962818 /NCGR_PEP_ID=MMETSP0011_2-20120614/6153_1 /TAXON_ID=101924 /ORGANISM="Rhodosorus marinus" /LENGTH=153 /DNA_ID=CAMNT_0000974767 /DNA_START=949 /DNA_END=1411 /DNA_ORIENTATION=+ /assembly_acc=CAM_ASM_000156